jgi:hypothetical protein
MNGASNDNGQVEVRLLEARFHPKGRADEYTVVGTIICQGTWAVVELVADLSESLTANLRYLTIMSRPRPFETLRAMDSRHWSFVPSSASPRTFDS